MSSVDGQSALAFVSNPCSRYPVFGTEVRTDNSTTLFALSLLMRLTQAYPSPTAILVDEFDAGTFQSTAKYGEGHVIGGRRHRRVVLSELSAADIQQLRFNDLRVRTRS